MKPSAPEPNPRHFLKALQEDGIKEIYLAHKFETPDPTLPLKSEEGQGWGKLANETSKAKLLTLREKVLQCTLCEELATTRKSVVFGAGNVKAKLMFVGEAPGHDEDVQGLPFVGRAGQLLTKIIESIGLTRRDVFIANVLKCRPPGNRQPRPEEILNCEPYLKKQIEWMHPHTLCALGAFAAQTLLKTGSPISQLRGRFYEYQGIKVLCTFHPAYLLRNPSEKRKVWDDMKMIKKELETVTG